MEECGNYSRRVYIYFIYIRVYNIYIYNIIYIVGKYSSKEDSTKL